MSFLIVLGLCIGLVWGTWFVFRGSPIAGCLIFLLTASCFGYEWLNFDVGPIPLTLDRLVLLTVLAAAAGQWWIGRLDMKHLRTVDKVALVFAGVLLLRTFGNEAERFIQGDMPPIMRLALGYMIPLMVYFLARQSRITQHQMKLVQATLVTFGVYLAITGLLEVHQQWWGVFPKYIANPEIGLHFGRARGPMVMAVSYGLFLATCLLAAWFCLLRVPRVYKVPLVGLMALFLAGIYYSYTRSVWLGTGVGILVAVGFTIHESWRKLVLGSMIAAALVVGIVKMDAILGLKREGSVADTRESVSMRSSFAYVSWQMFLDRPLLGFGFGQFPHAKLPYLADRSTDLQLETIRPYVHHNTFLSLLTETGLVGLGLYLAMLGGWAWQSVSILRREVPDWVRYQAVFSLAVLGIYVCQLLAHELSYSAIDNSLVFLMTGITSGLYARFVPTRKEEKAAQWKKLQAAEPPLPAAV